MIKNIIILFSLFILAKNSYGQPGQPSPLRKVSGIVIDSTQQSVIGAIVILTSKTDTMRTSTNEDGLFFFKNVKAWEFSLTVRSLGYGGFVKVGKYNDTDALLTMDPIILKQTSTVLNEVIVDGTPSIVYKVDTVEYKAADYKVREGAAVEDLLKKMEGMEVDKDGNLYFNGSIVTAAKLNGKNFIDGNISTVTKNLPADIISKVQIINDYGDQAARTGIKDGASQQVLNVTTKAERSLGYFAKMSGGVGNDSRYDGDLTGARINANRNFALAGNISNTVNGVPTNIGGIIGSRGDSQNGQDNGNTVNKAVGISYRDQWGPRIQANINYSFGLKNINSLTSRVFQDFSTSGLTLSNDEGSQSNKSSGHKLKFEMDNSIDSSNFLKISSNFSHTSYSGDDRFSKVFSGLIRQNQEQNNFNQQTSPSYSLDVLFQHFFEKKGRNFSADLNSSISQYNQERDLNSNILYFDKITNVILKDSTIQRLIDRNHRTNTLRTSLTYSEPINAHSAIQFLSSITTKGYDNGTIASSVNSFGMSLPVDSLSNVFKYSFTQARLALGYKYSKKRYSIAVGTAALPIVLEGGSKNTGIFVRRTSFNLLPIFRLEYSWTLQQQITVNYSGNPIEPQFSQIQPIRDIANPQSPEIGNPNLKTAFSHALNTTYNNYYPNSQIGLNAGFNIGFYRNRVISNIIQVADAYKSLIYERHYLNANGSYFVRGNYRLTKQLADRKYGLRFLGSIDHQRNIGKSNNFENISDQLTLTNELGLRASPSENFEINPSISYTFSFSENTLPAFYDNKIDVFSLNVNGVKYFMKTWLAGYTVSKNFVRGISSNIANNPLIADVYLEKDFFKLKGVKMRLQAFDIFNQNRFINRSFTETSITDTRTSLQSRYFQISLTGNLQKWKGSPVRNGRAMQRRGDGSFIY